MMKNRIEILRKHISEMGSNLPDTEERRSIHNHLYAVSQFCALIAFKRGESVELATMAGLLHDIYTYRFEDSKHHAKKGAVLAGEILQTLQISDERETEMIVSAIANHSSKGKRHRPFDEVLIDADVMQHYLYNPTAPIMEHEKARFTQLADEFGLRLCLTQNE